jgi:hypothetical protein
LKRGQFLILEEEQRDLTVCRGEHVRKCIRERNKIGLK